MSRSICEQVSGSHDPGEHMSFGQGRILTLTDTGPLVALFNRTDAAHGRCVDTLSEFRLA